MSHTLRQVGFFCALLILARALPAQTITTGALSGVVRDTLGQPINGARVEVTDQATGFRRDLTTARSGEYGFRLLPPGRYDVLAEVLGYRPTEVRGVSIVTSSMTEVERGVQVSPRLLLLR